LLSKKKEREIFREEGKWRAKLLSDCQDTKVLKCSEIEPDLPDSLGKSYRKLHGRITNYLYQLDRIS